MTTFAGIVAIIREVLPDTTQWPDATIKVWINQGIRDYSHYFPYAGQEAVACIAATSEYALGGTYCTGINSVLRVEYPDGQTPPRYLARLDQSSPLFQGGQFYDVRGEPPNLLVIGESPTLGQYIDTQFTKNHKALSADADVTTVPDIHLEAISIFAIWKAAEEIFMTEEIDPDTKEFLVSQMGLNATRYERVYRNKIAKYQSGSQSRRAAPWLMDEHDRIY